MLFKRILVNFALLSEGKLKLREIPPKIINQVFNYSKLARHAKRKRFAIDEVIVRPIEASDQSRYCDFANRNLTKGQSGPETIVTIPKCDERFFYYIALYRERIIGRVELKKVSSDSINFWQASSLYVLEDFRGYGIGEKLLKTGLSAIAEESYNIFLYVAKDELKAKKLYRKLGFRVADEQEPLKKGVIKYCLRK